MSEEVATADEIRETDLDWDPRGEISSSNGITTVLCLNVERNIRRRYCQNKKNRRWNKRDYQK